MAYDVAVVGGGLIGAACADALSGAGLRVCVLEAGPFVREASWAGAGLVHPIHPWRYPVALQALLKRAAELHPACAADLRERTGVDVELVESGLVVMDEELDRLEEWCGPGNSRRVDAAAEEPAIRQSGPALLVPAASHVKNHRLARAFLEGARRRGAELSDYTRVTAINRGSVETSRGRVEAREILICSGAWAAELLPGLRVEPIRGQILLYRGSMGRVVIFPEGEYAVPRLGGRVLFGSTVENAGFRPFPTREACTRLERRAQELLGLEPSNRVAAWAGLRPGTSDLLPYLGRDPVRPGLMVACGHFRNGILLAPLTARIVRDLALRRDPGVDLGPFSPQRP